MYGTKIRYVANVSVEAAKIICEMKNTKIRKTFKYGTSSIKGISFSKL